MCDALSGHRPERGGFSGTRGRRGVLGDVQPWGVLMAASLLTAVPVVVIYMLGQKFMVAGLTAGSVKG